MLFKKLQGRKKKNKNKGTFFKKLPGARYGIWRCLYIQGWDCDLCQPLVAKEVMNLFQMVSKSYYMHWIRFWVLRLYMLSAVIFSSVFIFRRLTEVRHARIYRIREVIKCYVLCNYAVCLDYAK